MTQEATVRIPHSLGQAEAKRRIVKGVDALEGEYAKYLSGVNTRWDGSRMSFRLSALSQTVEGGVEVADSYVEVTARLPFLLGLLANKFLPKVETTGQKLLK